jgi:hypothetical protein
MDQIDQDEWNLISATAASKTTSLPLYELPQSVDFALQTQLAEAHRLVGAAIAHDEMAVLGFRLSAESNVIREAADKDVKFFPYAWRADFGAAMTVSVKTREPTARVFFWKVVRCPTFNGSRQIPVRLLRRQHSCSLLQSGLWRAFEDGSR